MLDTLFTQTCSKCGGLYHTLTEEKENRACLVCCFPDKKNKVFKNYNPNYTRYISSEVKQAVWNRDGGKCVCCGSSIRLEFDHVIPVAKGGSNFENNIQLLCYDCNRTKSTNIV